MIFSTIFFSWSVVLFGL